MPITREYYPLGSLTALCVAALPLLAQGADALVSPDNREQVMKVRRTFEQVRHGMRREEVIKRIGKPFRSEADRWNNRNDYYFRHESKPTESTKNAAIRIHYDREGTLYSRSLAPVFGLRESEVEGAIGLGKTRAEIVQAIGYSPHRWNCTRYDPPVKLNTGDGFHHNGLLMARQESHHPRRADDSKSSLRLFFSPDDRLIHWRLEEYYHSDKSIRRSEVAAGVSSSKVKRRPIDRVIAALASDHHDSVYLVLRTLEKLLPESTKGISLNRPRSVSREAVLRLINRLKNLDPEQQKRIHDAYLTNWKYHSPIRLERWK